MNNRERFWRMIHFEEIDRLPFWADWLGPWKRWQAEGLDVDTSADDGALREWCLDRFGFEGMYSIFWGVPRVPVDIGIYPAYEREVYEETGAYTVYRAGNGTVVRQFKDPGGSLVSTQFLEYPIRTRADWVRLRDGHLDPNAPGRYPPLAQWQACLQALATRDAAVSIDGGSFYGYLRDWVGPENLSLMFYDDPGLIQEMTDYLADFFVSVLHRALHDARERIDFAMFWEDMCYKSGPLVSPAMFRRFMLPGYKKVTSCLAEHGVELSWVDCDGNIEALIPLWIEGGVRGFYPLEVASGMDAAKLQRQYGQQIVMWGNVDKRALAAGPAAIDAELDRLEPAVRQGGFIPLVDHGVPDDVPLSHYLYYLEQRKKRWHTTR
jgi:hypothetical protein